MQELDGRFTVIVIDGDLSDYVSTGETAALQYDGLTWADCVELVRLSFTQGYTAVIWKQEGGENGETEIYTEAVRE